MKSTEMIKLLEKYTIFLVAIVKFYNNRAPEILKIWKVNFTFLSTSSTFLASSLTRLLSVSYCIKPGQWKRSFERYFKEVYKFYLWNKMFRKTNSSLSISYRIKQPRVIYFASFPVQMLTITVSHNNKISGVKDDRKKWKNENEQ